MFRKVGYKKWLQVLKNWDSIISFSFHNTMTYDFILIYNFGVDILKTWKFNVLISIDLLVDNMFMIRN
jgi:hypothetical protein